MCVRECVSEYVCHRVYLRSHVYRYNGNAKKGI